MEAQRRKRLFVSREIKERGGSWIGLEASVRFLYGNGKKHPWQKEKQTYVGKCMFKGLQVAGWYLPAFPPQPTHMYNLPVRRCITCWNWCEARFQATGRSGYGPCWGAMTSHRWVIWAVCMAWQPDCLGSNSTFASHYLCSLGSLLTILCLSFLTINVSTIIEPMLYGCPEY